MPLDTWAHEPTVTPHGYGFSIPVAVTHIPAEEPAGEENTPAVGDRWEGVRLEVRTLASADIAAAVDADPDATPGHLTEALARALDQAAPGVQPQIDAIIDTLLEV